MDKLLSTAASILNLDTVIYYETNDTTEVVIYEAATMDDVSNDSNDPHPSSSG